MGNRLKEENNDLKNKMKEQNKKVFEERNKLKNGILSNEKIKKSMIEKKKEWDFEKKALIEENKKLIKESKVIRDECDNLLQREQQFRAKLNEISSDSDASMDAVMNSTKFDDDKRTFDENAFDDEKDNNINMQSIEELQSWENDICEQVKNLEKISRECRCEYFKKKLKNGGKVWEKERAKKSKE